MITLHILGAGGATPGPDRGPSAYWLEIDGHGLLLEAGSGALVRLVRQPGAPDSVDAINMVFLSHLHLDHAADLAPMLFAMHSVLSRNREPCLLAGPSGLAAYLARLQDLYGDWLKPHDRVLIVREMAAGESIELAAGGKAEAFLVEHAEKRFSDFCLGWSFTDAAGNRLVYSGDTGPCSALENAALGCDLLLVECSTPDDLAVEGHLSPGRVIDLVSRARPARVVLTHLYPLVAAQEPGPAISEATGIPCTAARDGDTFHLLRQGGSS
jgi:ribonuclease BN (tRNA processing enzyme)